MSVLEISGVERPVCRRADALGILHSKLNPMGRRGWPDRCFWLPGKPLLMEFKRRRKLPTKLQRYVAKKLLNLEYEVEFYDNKEDAIRSLEEHWYSRSA